MKAHHHLSTALLVATVAWIAPTIAQTTNPGQPANQSQEAQAPAFSAQEIDSLLAPIALYPDSLLSQVLMASTYPLEIVQAARWSKANNNKGGDAALTQAGEQTWDPSVQSLVAFPQVLVMMSDQLDWTQKLGDAFLAQQGDVMASIQRLRVQAQSAGSLNTTEQQKVVQQGQTIIIEPAQPSVIYVPAYNPSVVYGAWAYPAYPPVYYPGVAAWYPGQSFVRGMAWGAGVAASAAIFGGFNWNNRDVNINVNNFNRINRNNVYSGNGNQWRHNPDHRGSVAYRDGASRQRYSNNTRNAAAGTAARNDFRGHAPATSAGNRQLDGGLNRTAATARQAPTVDRSTQRAAAQNHDFKGTGQKRDAFQGVDSGRQQIDRGRASSAAMNRGGDRQAHAAAGGGGHRGGGGGGGRGHGR